MGFETALATVGTAAVGLVSYVTGYVAPANPKGNLANLEVNDLENIDSRILADARNGSRPPLPQLSQADRDFVKNIRQSQQEAKRARRLTTADASQWPTRGGKKVDCWNEHTNELMYSPPYVVGRRYVQNYCLGSVAGYVGAGSIVYKKQCSGDAPLNGLTPPPSWTPTGEGIGLGPTSYSDATPGFLAFNEDCHLVAEECADFRAFREDSGNITQPAHPGYCEGRLKVSTATPTPTPTPSQSLESSSAFENITSVLPTSQFDNTTSIISTAEFENITETVSAFKSSPSFSAVQTTTAGVEKSTGPWVSPSPFPGDGSASGSGSGDEENSTVWYDASSNFGYSTTDVYVATSSAAEPETSSFGAFTPSPTPEIDENGTAWYTPSSSFDFEPSSTKAPGITSSQVELSVEPSNEPATSTTEGLPTTPTGDRLNIPLIAGAAGGAGGLLTLLGAGLAIGAAVKAARRKEEFNIPEYTQPPAPVRAPAAVEIELQTTPAVVVEVVPAQAPAPDAVVEERAV